jgi:hypothetical protein
MAKKKLAEGSVWVRVIGQPVFEEGAHQAKGAVFATTAERAAALGDLVEPAAAPAEEAEAPTE